jgi:hypothetical protein
MEKKCWKIANKKIILIHLGYPYQFFCYESSFRKDDVQKNNLMKTLVC